MSKLKDSVPQNMHKVIHYIVLFMYITIVIENINLNNKGFFVIEAWKLLNNKVMSKNG